MMQRFLSSMGQFPQSRFHRFTTLPLVVVLALAAAGCGEEEQCNTKERKLSGDTQGKAGVSPNALLEESAELNVGVQWQTNPSFLQRGFSGRTRLTVSVEAAGDGFDSNTGSDCSPYVGVPVQVRLTTTDGVVTEAQGEGKLSSFEDGFRDLEAVFKASDISGSIAPTNDADLILRMTWFGELYEGSVVARVVHQGDARVSVNQVDIGLIDSGKAGDENPPPVVASGMPSIVPVDPELEPVVPVGSVAPVATSVSTADAGAAVPEAEPDAGE